MQFLHFYCEQLSSTLPLFFVIILNAAEKSKYRNIPLETLCCNLNVLNTCWQ